jgi:hypothetical protein
MLRSCREAGFRHCIQKAPHTDLGCTAATGWWSAVLSQSDWCLCVDQDEGDGRWVMGGNMGHDRVGGGGVGTHLERV